MSHDHSPLVISKFFGGYHVQETVQVEGLLSLNGTNKLFLKLRLFALIYQLLCLIKIIIINYKQ